MMTTADAEPRVRETIQYPVQALMLFFICLLQQPDNTHADAHLRAMDDATKSMSTLVKNQEDCFVQPLLTLGHELTRIARAAVQKGKAKADKAPPEHTQNAVSTSGSTIPHPLQPHTNSSTNFFNSAPTIPLLLNGGISLGVETPESISQGSGAAHTPTEHFAAAVTHQEPFDFEQGITGIDQLSDLPLSFSWNWQDLSAGLLEDFNLF